MEGGGEKIKEGRWEGKRRERLEEELRVSEGEEGRGV